MQAEHLFSNGYRHRHSLLLLFTLRMFLASTFIQHLNFWKWKKVTLTYSSQMSLWCSYRWSSPESRGGNMCCVQISLKQLLESEEKEEVFISDSPHKNRKLPTDKRYPWLCSWKSSSLQKEGHVCLPDQCNSLPLHSPLPKIGKLTHLLWKEDEK